MTDDKDAQDEWPASNEDLLRQGECPRPDCIELAGHTGPCSGEAMTDDAQTCPEAPDDRHYPIERTPDVETCWACAQVWPCDWRVAQSQIAALLEENKRYRNALEGEDDELLEIGRRAVERLLVEFRDSRISEFQRGNGLVIREKDGTDSSIVRFGPEVALRTGMRAILAALEGDE